MNELLRKWMPPLLALALLAASLPGLAQSIKADDLPAPVKQAIQSDLSNGAKLGSINRSARGDEVSFYMQINRPKQKRLHLIVGADGKEIDRWEDGQIRVHNGRLMRKDDPYSIHTILTGPAGDPDGSKHDFYNAFFGVSNVGGSALAFDLYGFDAEGNLSEKSAKYVAWIGGEVEIFWTGGVCRVLGPDAPTSKEGRIKAAVSAAKALANVKQMVYWIDGPDAAEIAAAFKKAAPGLTVAAPNGDLITEGEGAPKLMVGAMPEAKNGNYILNNEPASYEALEKASMLPDEKQPWTPDNSVLSKEERDEGFISLFDGKTLNGWAPLGRRDGFAVEDGAIVWKRSGGVALQSRNRYADFIFRMEYKIGKNINSGAQFRTPRANRASRTGFELQLFGDYGMAPTKHLTGAVYDVLAPTENASKPSGEWNQVEVDFRGPKLKVTINGKVVQDISFDDYEELKYRLRDGFIRLQDHGGFVAFRNIRIKEL